MTNEVLVRPCQFGNPVVWAAKNAKEHAALLPPSSVHHSLRPSNSKPLHLSVQGKMNYK
jgi:hypothetical protein